MSTVGLVRKRLIWKELRQQIPLIVVSVVVTLILYFLMLLNSFQGAFNAWAIEILLVGLPGLFAVGIGALLIGQEKEQRTILWLQSLPVAKQELVRSKLIASLIGLTILWIVSLVLVTIFSGGEYWRAGNHLAAMDGVIGFAVNPVHTLFLVLAGLAISWRVKSAFTALLLLIPVAFVPFVMATLAGLLASQPAGDDVGSAILLTCQLICCGVAAYWGWRSGIAALRPTATGRQANSKFAAQISLGQPYPVFSALLWQFARQNRLQLVGIACLFLVSLLLAVTTRTAISPRAANYLPIGVLMGVNFGLLAASWLGVMVFQSDRQHRRIQFLADRGLPPGITWQSRQAIPLSMLAIGLILIIGATALSVKHLALPSPSNQLVALEILSWLVVPVLFVGATTYAVSQWVSQLLGSPIVAAVAAPITSLAAAIYLFFCFQDIGTSLVLISALVLMPIVVTRILMRRWMDNRWDRIFWITHATAAILFVVLPVLPLAHAWLTSPTLNSATAKSMTQHLNKLGIVPTAVRSASSGSPSSSTKFLSLQLPPLRENQDVNVPSSIDPDDPSPSAELARQPALDDLNIQQRSAYALQRLKAQLDTSTGAVSVTVNLIQWLRTEMMMERLRVQSGDKSRYNQLVLLAARIAQRLRQSTQLADQEMADRMEIVLVAELLQAKGTNLLDQATWKSLCSQLGDPSSRATARRTAIAATWKRESAADNRNNSELGLDRHGNSVNLIHFVTRRSRVANVLQLLWQLSDAQNGDSVAIRSQLASALSVSPASYGLGEQGKFQRADDALSFLFESGESIRTFSFGSQWHAGWERQAQQLAIELAAKPDNKIDNKIDNETGSETDSKPAEVK